MKIIAVVVTNNRLGLLKECLTALQNQSRSLDEIVVINNGSTDGTTEWLATQPFFIINQANLGASGGFYQGVKTAYQRGADWIWILDDDTIAHANALEELIKPLGSSAANKIGYTVSKAIWTDGAIHLMNVPDIKSIVQGIPFDYYKSSGFELSNAASFVSLLVSKEVVKELGLPIKEFFIWGDDTEFSMRITKAGYIGAYVPSSVVLHKTATNYSADIFSATPAEAWKHFYGIRNKLFCRRMWKGEFSFWRNIFKGLFVMPFKLMRKRKDHRIQFILLNWRATWSAIFFTPAIEKIV